jgi:hypothetical protein
MARQRIGGAHHTERGKKHGGCQQKESNRAMSEAKMRGGMEPKWSMLSPDARAQ